MGLKFHTKHGFLVRGGFIITDCKIKTKKKLDTQNKRAEGVTCKRAKSLNE
jgi:hypothetical protein